MRVALLCATRRGQLFLRELSSLLPGGGLTVFSFREEPWEPPFFDEIRELTLRGGGQFQEARQVGAERWARFWDEADLDLMFVVSWRYMIPPHVCRRPRLGTFVFHDSLLPAYRGFAPTVWAMLNGESETGVTLFEIAEEVDAGDIVDQERVPLGPDEPIAEVMGRVTSAYLTLLRRNLGALLAGEAPRRPQEHSRATYTCKRLPEDNRIDWGAPSDAVYNLIRAAGEPYTGAYTFLEGEEVRVWSARRVEGGRRYVGRVAGRVVEVSPGEGSVVLTGDGALLLTRVQTRGGPVVCAAEVLKSLGQTLR